jgi:hypothetical protein
MVIHGTLAAAVHVDCVHGGADWFTAARLFDKLAPLKTALAGDIAYVQRAGSASNSSLTIASAVRADVRMHRVPEHDHEPAVVPPEKLLKPPKLEELSEIACIVFPTSGT